MESIKVNNQVFQQWREYYNGFPMTDDLREALIDYVGNLLSNMACVTFDAEHLAKMLGLENKALFAVINAP